MPCVCVFCGRPRGYYCSLWLPRDSTALIRSGSYTRRRWDDDLKNSEGSASTNRTSSYQRRLEPWQQRHPFTPPPLNPPSSHQIPVAGPSDAVNQARAACIASACEPEMCTHTLPSSSSSSCSHANQPPAPRSVTPTESVA